MMALNKAGGGRTSFLLEIVAPQDGFNTFDQVFLRAVDSVKLFVPGSPP